MKLAIYVWRGEPQSIAKSFRRRGFKVRVDGRHILFDDSAELRKITEALRRYVIATRRTILYQFPHL
jgi:hypothetical protein